MNVRLVYADDPGREIPVDCVFAGVDVDRVDGRLERLDAWLVLNPRPEPPVALRAERLPPNASLRVTFAPNREVDDATTTP